MITFVHKLLVRYDEQNIQMVSLHNDRAVGNMVDIESHCHLQRTLLGIYSVRIDYYWIVRLSVRGVTLMPDCRRETCLRICQSI